MQSAKLALFIEYLQINFGSTLMIWPHKNVCAVFICVFVYIYCNKVVTSIVFLWTFLCAIIRFSILSFPQCDSVYCTAGLGLNKCPAANNHRAKKTENVVDSTVPIYFFTSVYFPGRPYNHLNHMHQNLTGHQRLFYTPYLGRMQ